MVINFNPDYLKFREDLKAYESNRQKLELTQKGAGLAFLVMVILIGLLPSEPFAYLGALVAVGVAIWTSRKLTHLRRPSSPGIVGFLD